MREALKRRRIDDHWKTKRTSSPKAIAQILSSPAVVTVVRKEPARHWYRAGAAPRY